MGIFDGFEVVGAIVGQNVGATDGVDVVGINDGFEVVGAKVGRHVGLADG